MEDEIVFPALKKAAQEGAEIVEDVEKAHPKLDEELQSLTKTITEINHEDDNVDDDLQKFIDEGWRSSALHLILTVPSATKFFGEYQNHIEDEEKRLIPLARRHMDEKQQKEVGKSISDRQKKLEYGKVCLPSTSFKPLLHLPFYGIVVSIGNVQGHCQFRS